MIKGLTPAGIGPIDQMDRYVELASRHGFGAVDCDGSMLVDWIDDKGIEHAKAALNKYGVRIGSINLSVEWRKSEQQFRDTLHRFAAEVKSASDLGCRACCTYILPSVDENPAHMLALATRRLESCAALLDCYGMRLGLEFVGPHHLRRRWKYPFIDSMPATLDWIDAIGRSNVGLLLDVYHWYTTESSLEDIQALAPSQIVHVHINDAPDVPVEEALDNERLYPGEGVIDIKQFLQALKEIGYDGVVSQEILTKEPPSDPMEQLVQRSKQAFERVWPD